MTIQIQFCSYFTATSCEPVQSYPPESNIQLYRVLPLKGITLNILIIFWRKKEKCCCLIKNKKKNKSSFYIFLNKVTYNENQYYGTYTSSCPSGYYLLSCGFDNSKYTKIPTFQRTSIPINSTTCQCTDPSGMNCVAWCTAYPIQVWVEIHKTS